MLQRCVQDLKVFENSLSFFFEPWAKEASTRPKQRLIRTLRSNSVDFFYFDFLGPDSIKNLKCISDTFQILDTGGGDLTDGVGLVVKALLPLISPSTRAAPGNVMINSARDQYQHNIPQAQEQHPIKTRAKVPKNSATIDLDGAASRFEVLVCPTSLDGATSSDLRDQCREGWPWPAPPQAGHLDGLLLHHQPYLLLHPHLDREAAAVCLVLVLRAAHTRSESQERNKTKSFLSSRRSPSAGQLTSSAKS